MIRVLKYIGLAVVAPGVLFCQAAAPAFETAEIHAAVNAANATMQGGLRDGQYEVQSASLMDLVTTAYGLDADKVVGAPAWFTKDRFDLIAKAPPSASLDTVRMMLRTLLTDRFKLVVHNDARPASGFVLSLGADKPKMKEASGTGITGCRLQPPPPAVPGMVFDNIYSCHNMTMAAFAATLPGLARAYLPTPVTDSTGLKGRWDFDLKWTSKGSLRLVANGVTLFEAIEKQLGLKLGMDTYSAPVLVIDHAEQMN